MDLSLYLQSKSNKILEKVEKIENLHKIFEAKDDKNLELDANKKSKFKRKKFKKKKILRKKN